MKILNNNILGIICLLFFSTCIRARVYVQVINQLEDGQRLNVHCQSRDDDLGYHVLDFGSATTWSFTANFWGTTLFYCDVQWDDSNWYHFDVYDADRDYRRCRSMCRWIISRDGSLYGYNEESGFWEWFPFIAFS
ncbi:hypothetical protein BUALT_Bualt13G0052400 [Buddleja alternifolia]|uniref:S-protein homolog n=1 Tax=Buddleja alternifolia TaxID=168488 RepID=A0AAV6WS48_9LAMI|nr:hypothetical protein BUALT_Bualt13G0052400 [Buddleja alternifolia]